MDEQLGLLKIDPFSNMGFQYILLHVSTLNLSPHMKSMIKGGSNTLVLISNTPCFGSKAKQTSLLYKIIGGDMTTIKNRKEGSATLQYPLLRKYGWYRCVLTYRHKGCGTPSSILTMLRSIRIGRPSNVGTQGLDKTA